MARVGQITHFSVILILMVILMMVPCINSHQIGFKPLNIHIHDNPILLMN